MQEVLVSQKSRLLEAGASLYKRAEKFRLRCVWQNDALWQCRRDLKRSKKTIHTYESLLRSQGQALPVSTVPVSMPSQPKQAHYCPFCDKVFESASYLDMHISRRHPASKDPTEIRDSIGQTKLQNTVAPPAKTVTTSALQTEGNSWHDECTHPSQISSLNDALKESNNKLRIVQQQLDNLQRQMQNPKPLRKEFDGKYEDKKAVAAQEKLRELELKFLDFEHQIKQLGQENSKLLKELNAAHSEVSGLKSEKRRFILSMDQHDEQVEELQQEIEELRKSLKKDYMKTSLDRKPKAVKDWLHAAEASLLRPQGSKKQNLPALELVQEPIPRRNTSVTIEDGEEVLSPDKQTWLSLHPYAPIPNLPYVLAKYPHSPALFISKRNEISRRLEKLLHEELLKFGIPPNAEGISDAKYAVVASALQKQRAFRLSSAAYNEKRVMEYERSIILWHIERAVHSRDMSILESIFDEETDSGASGNDPHVEEPYSDDEEIIKSPASRDQPLDPFEGPLSTRRSLSHQGSEHSGRWRDPSQLADMHAVSRNPDSPKSNDDVSSHTFQVVGQMTAKRVPSLTDEQTPHSNVVHSVVSSPVAAIPDDLGAFEENNGLGDWESDGEETTSFAQSSPRRAAKDEHYDVASISSRNTARLSDLDKRTI
ncbi:hypothetical protein KP509_24G061800 [Ceratopteris richardii]|uniref:C2H2-type domain-containing protein n=1 Tax=Ceratopteris richardii TaxID=49495 RepID=A0A8T2RVL2_CERRI|nr:hypothetical protein KP509_24G061800 [Ceratopteris richardii]